VAMIYNASDFNATVHLLLIKQLHWYASICTVVFQALFKNETYCEVIIVGC